MVNSTVGPWLWILLCISHSEPRSDVTADTRCLGGGRTLPARTLLLRVGAALHLGLDYTSCFPGCLLPSCCRLTVGIEVLFSGAPPSLCPLLFWSPLQWLLQRPGSRCPLSSFALPEGHPVPSPGSLHRSREVFGAVFGPLGLVFQPGLEMQLSGQVCACQVCVTER